MFGSLLFRFRFPVVGFDAVHRTFRIAEHYGMNGNGADGGVLQLAKVHRFGLEIVPTVIVIGQTGAASCRKR